MKEKLYTIPVNEAFDQPGECGFCALHRKLEKEILDYVMGPSYMEEDIRQEMDKAGFCKEHYRQMFAAGNRLGVALMLQSHLKKLNQDMEQLFRQERDAAKEKRKLFQKETTSSPVQEYTEKLTHSCYACERMGSRMESYIDTFFHLWKTEPEFRDKVLNGNGFCLEHLSRLLQEGKHRLSAQKYQEFLEVILPLQAEHMKRMEDEVDWFVQKFDYRFKDEPWKNAKDAVERGILKVSGTNLSEDKQ